MILYFNRFYFSIIKCKEYVRLRSYEIINIKIYLILLFWFSVRLVSYFLNMNKKLVAWLCVIFPLWIYLLALFCYHCDFVLSFALNFVAILYSVFLILYFVEALFEALLWTLLRNYILSFGYLYYIDVCSAPHSSKQVFVSPTTKIAPVFGIHLVA